MKWENYIATRILQIIPTLLVLTLVVFFLIRLLPGDPASAILGDRASDEAVKRVYIQYGLDKPLYIQFFIFVNKILHGDLGDSLVLKIPVYQVMMERIPVTLFLTCYAMTLALLIAFPLALIAAFNRDTFIDHLIRVVSQIGLSSPVFFVGLVLLSVLSAKLRLFPVGGYGDNFGERLYHLFLPSFSLALHQATIFMRNLRNSIIEVYDADYVDFAKAKGLNKRVIMVYYILRNAMISTVTLLGLSIGYLIGGAVITETVFAIPGAGRLIIDSIFGRDYPVIQGMTLSLAVLVSLIFLATDIVLAWLDPRVRNES